MKGRTRKIAGARRGQVDAAGPWDGLEPLESRVMMSAVIGGGLGVPPEPGLLLPAVQKVQEAATRTEELTAKAPDNAAAGLLLPAVQKVREAASRLSDKAGPGDHNVLAPLLLPAVQKVREAATRTEELAAKAPDNAVVGLLLPAVQKVRAAAG